VVLKFLLLHGGGHEDELQPAAHGEENLLPTKILPGGKVVLKFLLLHGGGHEDELEPAARGEENLLQDGEAEVHLQVALVDLQHINQCCGSGSRIWDPVPF
jgi:hypothetical protein